jgi:site-specific recombinase
MRGINKKEIFPKLINLLGRSNNFTVLKRAAKLFIAMLEEVDVADHVKFSKKELTNLLEIVKQNEHSSERFSRTARLLFKSLRIVNLYDLDVTVFNEFIKHTDENFYQINEKTRSHMT